MDDIKIFILSIVLIIVGVWIMLNHKFWKYDTSEMLSATKFKVFLSGFILCLIGFWGIITIILKFF